VTGDASRDSTAIPETGFVMTGRTPFGKIGLVQMDSSKRVADKQNWRYKQQVFKNGKFHTTTMEKFLLTVEYCGSSSRQRRMFLLSREDYWGSVYRIDPDADHDMSYTASVADCQA
jgi:hypothetical protein